MDVPVNFFSVKVIFSRQSGQNLHPKYYLQLISVKEVRGMLYYCNNESDGYIPESSICKRVSYVFHIQKSAVWYMYIEGMHHSRLLPKTQLIVRVVSPSNATVAILQKYLVSHHLHTCSRACTHSPHIQKQDPLDVKGSYLSLMWQIRAFNTKGTKWYCVSL